MRKSKVLIAALAGLCFALALAGCQAGGSNTASSGATSTPAPINVSQGYQGVVEVSFTSSTTYAQAVSILESAGMHLRGQCDNSGPIIVDVTPTTTPTGQEGTFASTHQLTAIGAPSLTQDMLNQVATSTQVTAIDQAPPVACPHNS